MNNVNIKNNIGKMNKNLENKIIFGIMFEVNLLFYGSSGGHKMDQKSFELLANMYTK